MAVAEEKLILAIEVSLAAATGSTDSDVMMLSWGGGVGRVKVGVK